MNYTLFLTLQGVIWEAYGPRFDSQEEADRHTVSYSFENDWEDADLFYDDIESINQQCDSLLSYGDLEYFNTTQCAKLVVWIENRLRDDPSSRYRELLEVLACFCKRAEELGTGVYIDL